MLQSVSFNLPEMGSISAGKAADCDRMAAVDAIGSFKSHERRFKTAVFATDFYKMVSNRLAEY